MHEHIISRLLAYLNMKAGICAKHDGSMIIF
jgi:hypothetical protein